jgi:hypothetical protein
METIERLMGGNFECECCHSKRCPEHDAKLIPINGDLKWVCFKCASAIRHNQRDRGWFAYLEKHPEKRKEYALDKLAVAKA